MSISPGRISARRISTRRISARRLSPAPPVTMTVHPKLPLPNISPLVKTRPVKTKPVKIKVKESTELQDSQQILPSKSENIYCKSIKSLSERGSRCELRATDNGYCDVHMLFGDIIDYDESNVHISSKMNEIVDTLDESSTILSTKCLQNNTNLYFNDISTNKTSQTKPAPIDSEMFIKTHSFASYTDIITETDGKLMILINEKNDLDEIENLIGPVFHDITLSDDEFDPITLDQFFVVKNNKKIPCDFSKYLLFSYNDSNNKIRCMTIFSIRSIIKTDNKIHPMTYQKIPDDVINRAKKLIEIYTNKLDLFGDLISSIPILLKDRLDNLFKKFETFSIYFESQWIFNIDTSDIHKIIIAMKNSINHNIRAINKYITKSSLFEKKFPPDTPKNIMIDYLVDEWAVLFDMRSPENNQMPIWIIGGELRNYVPEISQKYPHLNNIF